MDLVEAIKARKAIRAFKPDPVPQDILKEILKQAQNAPSWANTQPWEFAIVTGSKLEEIKKGFLERAEQPLVMDVPNPPEMPEPYIGRIRKLGDKEYTMLGIKREDKQGRGSWRLNNLQSFGAPCVIYILIDRAFYFQPKGINAWAVFDCGAIEQNIMLLATNYGLGTLAQAQAVAYPSVIRKVIGIPEAKLLLVGIAIGYPDWNNKSAKEFRSDKEPLDNIIQWYGFD